ncbi:MAG: hypothetical protein P1U56_02340 [Saprospiraceae bacterium]|nr:hypothetical protein [Saprospiraceae bacterium]
MRYSILFVFTLTFCTTVWSQDGGMRVYAGITSMINKDKIANPSGFSHTGYHIGVDGRLMSGGMAFIVGGRFTSVSKLATEDFQLSGHEATLTTLNGRAGLDFSIFSFTPLFRLRTKALASFDVLLNQSDQPDPPAGYKFNDGWLGLVTGLGADIGPAVIDIEYELGVVNAYNMKKESTFNSWTLSIGFFF